MAKYNGLTFKPHRAFSEKEKNMTLAEMDSILDLHGILNLECLIVPMSMEIHKNFHIATKVFMRICKKTIGLIFISAKKMVSIMFHAHIR